MNLTAELWAFALVMAIGQFSPGPDMLLLTRTALAEGLRAGWLMVAGIVTGLAFHATLAIGGMAVLLARGGILSFIVKIA
ncbi:LysE family transporter, partial [Akkermansiaceae bacterium]|nr:LysE family transporter [Akkermansiaceae bacterium]